MIKQKYFSIVCYVAASILCHVTQVNAKTNYDSLHTHHDIVAKYECGKQGYQAISKDGYGGYSYGKWQISTQRKNSKPSTFDFFLTYLKDRNTNYYMKLMNVGGYKAAYNGNKYFISTWKRIAQQKAFQNIYDSFLLDTQIIPVYSRMDKNGNVNFDKVTTWASEDNAIQAAIKSTIIQHGQGGAYKIFQNILFGKVYYTKESFLKKLYAYRSYKYPKCRDRYRKELRDLERYLVSGESRIKKTKIAEVKVKKPDSDSILDKLAKLIS